MDTIIGFFRDTLDGPIYIVWLVGCLILIFACIGYLAEKGIKNKKEKEKYANVNDTNNDVPVATTISEEEAVPNEVEKQVQESVATDSVSSVPSEEVKPVSTQPVETTSVVSSDVVEDKQITSNTSQDIPSQPSGVVSNVSENNVVTQPVVEPVVTTVVSEPSALKVATTSVDVAPVPNTSADNVSNPQASTNSDNTSVSAEVVIPTINQDSK